MSRRFSSKPLPQPLPPVLPAAAGRLPLDLPHRDLMGGRPAIRLEGSRKQVLETGRTRLLVAAMSFTLAFALIGGRLVDLGLMSTEHEPSLARSLASDRSEEHTSELQSLMRIS